LVLVWALRWYFHFVISFNDPYRQRLMLDPNQAH
jgi:hypothetical protein